MFKVRANQHAFEGCADHFVAASEVEYTLRGPMTVTFIDLEFDTTKSGGAPMGDIASSLVSLHDLLRDLGSLAAYPSSVEYREIRVVGIEMRNPLKITVSLLAIPSEAVTGFQEICRNIIHSRREREHEAALSASQVKDVESKRRAAIDAALDRVLHAGGKHGQLTEQESERLYGHIATLQNAEVPLRRVVVREE